MRVDPSTSAAALARLLLRPNAQPAQKAQAIQPQASQASKTIAYKQTDHPVDRLTAEEEKRAYDAMDTLTKQLIDTSRGRFVDFSA